MAQKHFLTVHRGSFCEKKEDNQFIVHPSIKGHILGINYKKLPAGDLIRIHIVDEENLYMLSMFCNSRSAHAFFMLVSNVDFNVPIDLRITAGPQGKEIFQAFQHGAMVQWSFGPHNPFKLPLNVDERLAYLRDMINIEVIPRIQKVINPYPNHPIYKPFKAKSLQGGYFDAYANTAKIPGPISQDEKDYYEEHGY